MASSRRAPLCLRARWDPGDPLRHDRTPRIHLVRPEVIGHVVELKLEAVHRVAVHGFLDQGEPLIPHFLEFEIQAMQSREAGIDTAAGPDFQMGVIESEIRAPGVRSPLAGALLNQQDRVDQHPLGSGPVANDAQRIVSGIDEPPGVLVGPPEDQVGPLLDVVSPQLTHLGVMQHRPAVSHGEHDGFNGGSQQFVDGRFVLFLPHGRFVHVDEGVPPVVVEHHGGLAAG